MGFGIQWRLRLWLRFGFWWVLRSLGLYSGRCCDMEMDGVAVKEMNSVVHIWVEDIITVHRAQGEVFVLQFRSENIVAELVMNQKYLWFLLDDDADFVLFDGTFLHFIQNVFCPPGVSFSLSLLFLSPIPSNQMMLQLRSPHKSGFSSSSKVECVKTD